MHAGPALRPAAYLRQDEPLFQNVVAVVAGAAACVRGGQQRLHARVLGVKLPVAPPPHVQAREQQRCSAIRGIFVWIQGRNVSHQAATQPAYAPHGVRVVSTSRQQYSYPWHHLHKGEVSQQSAPTSATTTAAMTMPTSPPVLRPPPPLVLHAAELLMSRHCCGRHLAIFSKVQVRLSMMHEEEAHVAATAGSGDGAAADADAGPEADE